MARKSPKLDWCIVRLGEDMNWWVQEISDKIQWDLDGLSIIDPRQVAHIIDLLEPLHDYGFDPDIFESAFYAFRISENLGDGRVKLTRSRDTLLDTEEQLFALPDILDDATGPYADFIDHISNLRIQLLNDSIDFKQELTLDELEEEIRDEENNSFIEGRAVHTFTEISAILDYVPAGFELDDDDEDEESDEDDVDDVLPDLDVPIDDETLQEDETMRWDDDDEEEDEEDEDGMGTNLDDDDLADDEQKAPRRSGKRS